MPVWVKGNFDSEVIIVTVHGGPGDSGMEQHIATGFKMLEEDYLMVYWDQRYSGMTQGHADKETQTPDQFIEDTEKVVQLVQSKYPGRKLYMLGHSWGGQLAAGYLGRDKEPYPLCAADLGLHSRSVQLDDLASYGFLRWSGSRGRLNARLSPRRGWAHRQWRAPYGTID